MADYIDREKIFSIWRSMPAPASVTSLAAAISQTPAADVVEVVHCKDCIYYRNKECESDDFWSALCGDDIGLHYVPEPDFYCACGERRKGNA